MRFKNKPVRQNQASVAFSDRATSFDLETLESRELFTASPTLISTPPPPAIAVALIDRSLPDQALIAQSMPGVTRIYFDSSRRESAAMVLNAAIQASNRLSRQISELMVLSHGNAGLFSLGDDLLSVDHLAGTAPQWQGLSKHLAPGASIDLFACDLAASPVGQAVLNRVHQLTGASVYGSTNLTGRGGDWILEAHSQGASITAPKLPLDTRLLNSYPADLLLTTTIAAAATPSTVTTTTSALSVTMVDTAGTPTFTWTTTAKPTGASPTFSNNGTTTAGITTVTFNKAGSYTFLVTGTDGSASSTSSVSVTVNQTLTSIAVTPGTANVSLNATQTFAASALDQFGNAMGTQPGITWSRLGVGSISASGVFTSASLIGSSVISATSGLISGTATATVANAAPTVATAAAASSSTVTVTGVNLSVLGADDGGAANLTYTWAATTKPAGSAPVFSINGTNAAKATAVTFYTAGSYTFQATITDVYGASVTSSVSVTVTQTLGSIIVAPATPSLHLNQTQTFTDSALDQFGNVMGTSPTINWSLTAGSVGSMNANTGSYTSAATPGTATVDAVSAGITGADTVTVANATPTVASAAAGTPSTLSGTTTSALTVLGADDGSESNLTYTWAAISKPAGVASPTFSINGTNAAKNSTATFSASGTYILQATVTDAFGASTTSSVAVVANQGNPNITIAGTTALNLNQSQLFTSTAYDQFGNPLLVQPIFTWSLAAGSVGSISALTGIYNSGATPGTATVIATSGSYSASQAVTVTNAAPTVAATAACTPSPDVGTTGVLTVLGADDGGEANLTYTWAATTRPAGTAPTFSINGTNAAKASVVTFHAAGNYVFTVTISDGLLSTTSSASVTVNQTTTSITVAPTTAALNENGTQQFSAVANDQFGTAMATQPAFSWGTMVGSIGSVSTTGLYTAPGLAGSATIVVAAGLVTGSATVTIINAPPTVAVVATASPSTVTGTTTSLSVLGADDGGEPNLTYSWSATTKPSGASVFFNASGINAAKNATATFSAAGNYVLTAVISDGTNSVSSSVSVTVSQTLSTVAVSPSVTSLHENATQQFTATGYDQFGTVMATQPTFTWSKTSGVGTINSSGLYSTAAAIGSAVVKAASGSVSGIAAITVFNAAPTVATAAAATQSVITGATTILSVLGADDGGEANLTYTWAATVAPIGATVAFSANGTNAAKASVATFNTPGAYLLTATISDGTNTVNTSVAVTVVSTETTLAVTPSTVTLPENSTQLFTAVAYDQFGVPLLIQPVMTWSKTSGTGAVTALGTFTCGATAGSAVVSVSGGGLTNTAAVTVINAPPTIVIAAAATPSTVIGTGTILTVLGADDGGESNLTYTWAATIAPADGSATFSSNGANASKLSTATFNKAGSYTLTATVFDGTSTVTSAVVVTVSQTLSNITVTPASSAVNLNQTEQLNAQAFDQFGNLMSPQPTMLWTVLGGGSVTQGGLYTSAGAPIMGTVYASSSLISGSALVTVTNAAPTVATTASASPTSVTGLTTALSVLGADDGGETNLSYTWSAGSPAGATPVFSQNGTHSARNTTVTFNAIGSYTFTVTIADAFGATVTSSVGVTVSQTLTNISVSPISKTLSVGQTNQFTATSWDQFNNMMLVQPTIAWAVSSGGGTISSGGLFTAGGAAGSGVITASSGSVSGTASVTTVNSLAITSTVNALTGTSAMLGVLGLSGSATLAWSVTASPMGASASFDTTTGSTPTLTFSAAGNYTVQLGVTIAGITTTVNDTFTASQILTSVTATPVTSTLNENQSTLVLAIGSDQFGAPMVPQPAFSWSVISGNGSIGASTGIYTAGGASGLTTIRATSGGVYGNASITTINAAPTIATPALATPALITGTSTALSVLAADDGGEPLLQYTWAVTSAPSGASVTFASNGNNTAKNTTATFNRAGAYSFTVTVSDGTNTVTSSCTATVVQSPSDINVSAASTTLNETATDQLSATTFDQFGNPLTAQPTVIWTETDGLGLVNSAGLMVAGTTPGTADVRASVGSVFADQAITIVRGAPTVAVPAQASSATVTGTSTSLSVLGSDENGESTLSYTWTTTSAPIGATPTFSINGTNAAKNTVVTFNMAGAYTFKAVISNGLSTTSSSVNLTVAQTVSTIAVVPSVAGLNLQATQQFTAAGFDQFGNAMSTLPTFTWSINSGVGSVNSAGLYSSGTAAGVADVRASAGGVHGDATMTVTNATPTLITAAAASPGLVTGISTQLSALANDDGGASNLTYTWAATTEPTGAAPAYSDNDSNAAKTDTVYFNEAGNYTFTVTISDGTNSIVSATSVEVDQTMSAVTVIPPTASLPVGGGQQLGATAQDQFGSPLTNQPAFNWTLPTGSGSVTPSGLYSAGSADGTATVQAEVDGISGVSDLTVFGAPPVITASASASPSLVTGTFTNLAVTAGTTGSNPLSFAWVMTSGPTGANPLIANSVSGNNPATSTAHVVFNEAGSYEFQVTVSDGVESAVSSVAVTVDSTLTSLVVTDQSARMSVDQTQQITATAYDQFQASMTLPALNWAIASGGGSITTSGQFISGSTPGVTSVLAIAGLVTGNAPVDVEQYSLTLSQAANADTTVVSGTSTGLHARGAEGTTGDAGLVYNWSVVSGPAGVPAGFSPNNSNAARDTVVTFNEAGNYVLQATITDASGQAVTSTVDLTVVQTLVDIAVVAPQSTVTGGGSVQAVAQGTDQFDRSMSAAVNWSVDNGSIGMINSTGVFTVGNVTGQSTVRATSGSLSGTTSISSVQTATNLQVVANYTAPNMGSNTGVLQATATGDTSPNVNYTWQVVSQPSVVPTKKQLVEGGLPAGPLAIFGINGSQEAQSTPVMYAWPGTYVIKVVATDGSLSASDEISVVVAKKAVNPNLPVVSGLVPIVSDGLLLGYTVVFDQAMDPARTGDLRAYHISQSIEVPSGRTILDHLFDNNTGPRIVTRAVAVATAVYDPASFSVTLSLVKPLPLISSSVNVQVLGSGKYGLKDLAGNWLDGDDNGVEGGQFSYSVRLSVGTYTHTFADGSVGTLKLLGPGELIVVTMSNLPPLIYLHGCNPTTSLLVGSVTHRPRGFTTKPIQAVIGSDTAKVYLGDGFSLEG